MFGVVLLKVELEMCFFAVSELKSAQKLVYHQKLQFLDQNQWFSSKSAVFVKMHSFHQNPQFSSKFTVFIKIHSFCQNLQFSSKSAVFVEICSFHQKPRISVKIRDFHQNPRFLAFLSELSRRQHQQIGILCETKDHLPRKVTPIFPCLEITHLRPHSIY